MFDQSRRTFESELDHTALGSGNVVESGGCIWLLSDKPAAETGAAKDRLPTRQVIKGRMIGDNVS